MLTITQVLHITSKDAPDISGAVMDTVFWIFLISLENIVMTAFQVNTLIIIKDFSIIVKLFELWLYYRLFAFLIQSHAIAASGLIVYRSFRGTLMPRHSERGEESKMLFCIKELYFCRTLTSLGLEVCFGCFLSMKFY